MLYNDSCNIQRLSMNSCYSMCNESCTIHGIRIHAIFGFMQYSDSCNIQINAIFGLIQYSDSCNIQIHTIFRFMQYSDSSNIRILAIFKVITDSYQVYLMLANSHTHVQLLELIIET